MVPDETVQLLPLMVIAAVAGWKVLGTKHAAVQMQEDAPSV